MAVNAGFDINAALKLQAPANLDVIVTNIKSKLTNITANIDIGFKPGQAAQIDALNKRFITLNDNLSKVASNANNAAAAISEIGLALTGTSTRLSNLQQYLKAVSSGFVNIGKSVKPAGDTIEHFGQQSALAARRFTAFTVAAGAIVGVVSGIKAGLSEAIAFQQQIVKIGQITQQSTNNLKPLVDEVTRLSTTFGVSSKSLIEISNTLAQAGLSAKDTKVALEALAKTTLAPTFGDIKNTVEATIAATAQFKLGAQDLEKSLGSINAVAAAFAVESQDLTTVISKAGGVFKTLSGDLEAPTTQLNQLISLFTSVRQTTRESADTIATGFRTIFGRLTRPETIQFLETFGIKLTDVKGKFIGVFPAIQQLNQALKDLDPRDVNFARIVEQIGGLRQISRVIPLIQQFPVALRAMQVAQSGQNSLTVDAIRSQEAFTQKLSRTKEEFLDLFRVISQNKFLQGLAEVFLRTATAVAQVTKALEPLIPLLAAYSTFKAIPAAYSFGRGFFQYFTSQGITRKSQGGPVGYSSGGPVAGHGTGDIVPAMLEPKEFVIRKHSTQQLERNEPGALAYINAKGRLPQKKVRGDIANYVPDKHPIYDLNDTADIKYRDQIDDLIPPGSKYLSTGKDAVVFKTKNNTVLRIVRNPVQYKRSDNTVGTRLDIPEILQSINEHKVGPYVIEEVPYAQNLLDYRGISRNRKDKIQDALDKRILNRTGDVPIDLQMQNIGVLPRRKGQPTRFKAIDPDLFARGDLTKELFEKIDLISGDLKPLRKSPKFKKKILETLEQYPSDLGTLDTIVRSFKDLTYINSPLSINHPKFEGQFNKSPFPDKKVSGYYRPLNYNNLTGPSIVTNDTQGSLVHEITHAVDNYRGGGNYFSKYGSMESLIAHLISKDDRIKRFEQSYIQDPTAENFKTLNYLKDPPEVLARAVEKYYAGQKDIFKFNKGGKIPGYAAGDTVPALLTPQEYVINKDSAQAVGYSNLRYINEQGKLPGYNKGGIVGPQKMAFGDLLDRKIDFQTTYAGLSGAGQQKLSEELTRSTKRLLDTLNGQYTEAQIQNKAQQSLTRALKYGDTIVTDSFGKLIGFGRVVDLVKNKLDIQAKVTDEVSASLGQGYLSRLGGKGKFAIGAATVGAALIAPQAIETVAGKERGQAITTAFSGALTGAFVGQQIAGLKGAIIGAIISGFQTYFTSFRSIEAEKRQKESAERLEGFNQVLAANINRPGLDFRAKGAVTGVQAEFDKLQVEAEDRSRREGLFGTNFRLSDIGATEFERNRARQNTQRDFLRSNALSGYAVAQQNLEKLAQESTTFDRFSQAGGDQLLRLVASYKAIAEGSLDVASAEKELKKIIIEEISQRQKQVNLIRANDELADKFKDLYNNLGEFAVSLQAANNRIDNLSGGLGDVLSGQNLKLRGVSANLSLPPSRFTPDTQFKDALNQLLDPLGEAGKELSQFVLDQRRAVALIDPILKSVAKTATTTTIEGDIRGQLQERGIPKDIIENIVGRLKEFSGVEEGLEKALVKLQTDTTDTINKIKKDLLDFSTPLGAAGQALDKQNAAIYDSAIKITQFNDRLREETNKVGDIALQQRELTSRRQAERFGGSPLNYISLNEQQEPFRARVRSLAGSENPAQIGQNILEFNKRLKGETDKLKFAELQAQIRNSQKALELLANTSERSAKIEERLSLLKQQEEGRFDFFKRLVTAKPEDIPQLRQEINSANLGVSLLQRGGSLDQLPILLRSQVASALSGGFANFPFRSAGNLTGNDILRQFANRGLPSLGLPAGLTSYNFKERAEKTGLEREQDKIFSEAVIAQQRIVEVYQNAVNQEREIFGQSVEIFKESVSNFAKLLEQERIDTKNKPLVEQGTILKQALGKIPQASDVGIIEQFKANRPSIQLAAESIQQIKAIDKLGGREKIFGTISALPNVLQKTDEDFSKFTLNSKIGLDIEKLTGGAVGSEDTKKIFETTKTRLLDEIKNARPLFGGLFNPKALENVNELQRKFPEKLQSEFFKAVTDSVLSNREGLQKSVEQRRTGSGLGEQFDIFTQKIEEFGKVIEKVDLAKFGDMINVLGAAPGFARGGSVFKPRGTDTVPAMLSPNEFIVNSQSAIANRPLLDRINAAKGPVYLADGGEGSGKKRRRKKELSQEELDDLVKNTTKLKKDEILETQQVIKSFNTNYIKYKEGRKGTIIPSNLRSISKYEYALNVLSSGGGNVRTGPFKELNKNQPREQFKQNTLNLLDQLSESGLIKTRASELRDITRQLDREKYIKDIRRLAVKYKDSPTALKFAISELVTGQRGAAISKESRPELRAIQELEQRALTAGPDIYEEDVISTKKTKPFTGFTGGPRKGSKAYRQATRSIPDYGAYGGPRLPTISSAISAFYPAENIGRGERSGLPAIIPKTLGRRPFVPTPDVINLGGPKYQLGDPLPPLDPKIRAIHQAEIDRLFESENQNRLKYSRRGHPGAFPNSGLILPPSSTTQTQPGNIPSIIDPGIGPRNRRVDPGDFAQRTGRGPYVQTTLFDNTLDAPDPPFGPFDNRPFRQPNLKARLSDIITPKTQRQIQEALRDARNRGPRITNFDRGAGAGFGSNIPLEAEIEGFRNLTGLQSEIKPKPPSVPFYQGRTARAGFSALAAYNLYEAGAGISRDFQNNEFTTETAGNIGVGALSLTHLAREAARLRPTRATSLVDVFKPKSLLNKTGRLLGKGAGKLAGGVGNLFNAAYAGGGAYEAYQAGYGNLGYSSYDEPSFQRGATRAIVGASTFIPVVGQGVGIGILAGEGAGYAVERFNPVASFAGRTADILTGQGFSGPGGISRGESERQRALVAQGTGFGKEIDPINQLERELESKGVRFKPYSQFGEDSYEATSYQIYQQALQQSVKEHVRKTGQDLGIQGDLLFAAQSQGQREFYRDRSIQESQFNRSKLEAGEEAQLQFLQRLEDDPEFRRRYLASIGAGYNRQFSDINKLYSGGANVLFKAEGGSIFKQRGTDTIPAMLTPDEFVVNAASAKANRAILEKINAAKGPIYRASGGSVRRKYTEEEVKRIPVGENITETQAQSNKQKDVDSIFSDVAFGKRLEAAGKGVPTASVRSKTFDIDSTKDIPTRRPVLGDNEGFVSNRVKRFDFDASQVEKRQISDAPFFNSKQDLAIRRFRSPAEIRSGQKSSTELVRESILKKRAAAFENRKEAEERGSSIAPIKVKPSDITDEVLQERLKAGNISGQITGFDIKRERKVTQQKEQADKVASLQNQRRQIKADAFNKGLEQRKQVRNQALEQARIAAAPETKIQNAAIRDQQEIQKKLFDKASDQQRLLPGYGRDAGQRAAALPGGLGVSPIGFQPAPQGATTQAGAAPGAATNAPQAQAQQQPAFDVGGLTQSVTRFGGFVDAFGKHVSSLTNLVGKLTDLKVTIQTDKLTVTVAEKDLLKTITQQMEQIIQGKANKEIASKGGPDSAGNLA